jgi:hypothetical protein
MPTAWAVVFLIWGQASPRARAMYPPPLFPKRSVNGDKTRSQEDMPDLVLDESVATSPGTLPAVPKESESDSESES